MSQRDPGPVMKRAGLEAAKAVGATAIAPHAARALVRLKKVKPLAISWLRSHPRHALHGLLPAAVGKEERWPRQQER